MKQCFPQIVLASFFILGIMGCKSDDAPTQTTNPPPATCNFTTNVVDVNGTTSNIIKSNCNTFGTYTAEFMIDTGSTSASGVVLLFSTSSSPDTGTYAMVDSVNLVTAGKVYVEYYDPSYAWTTHTGSVNVAANGAAKIFTFCSVDLYINPSTKKKVSLRGTCN